MLKRMISYFYKRPHYFPHLRFPHLWFFGYLSYLTLFRREPFRPRFKFSCIMTKRRNIFSSYLVTYPDFSSRTFRQNKKIVGSGQVRSPVRVCWPHLRKVGNHVRPRVFHGAICSLQVFITVPVCSGAARGGGWKGWDLTSSLIQGPRRFKL